MTARIILSSLLISLLVSCLSKTSPHTASNAVSELPANAPKTTQIVLLGTGTPNPDPDRSGPSVAIVVNGAAYIVDCGVGIVRRAAAAQRTGVEALAANKLTRAFVTHLHTDHTLGYPDLIFTSWGQGRNEPLEVYGPKGIKAMTEHLLFGVYK